MEFNGTFEENFNRVVELLKDRNVTLNGKCQIIDDFCQEYPYFNSSRFDKYIQ